MFLIYLYLSCLHQLQHRQEGDNDLYLGCLLFQEIPETESVMYLCILINIFQFLRKRNLFFLDLAELASDRIRLYLPVFSGYPEKISFSFVSVSPSRSVSRSTGSSYSFTSSGMVAPL